jgi:hypothetical protein
MTEMMNEEKVKRAEQVANVVSESATTTYKTLMNWAELRASMLRVSMDATPTLLITQTSRAALTAHVMTAVTSGMGHVGIWMHSVRRLM